MRHLGYTKDPNVRHCFKPLIVVPAFVIAASSVSLADTYTVAFSNSNPEAVFPRFDSRGGRRQLTAFHMVITGEQRGMWQVPAGLDGLAEVTTWEYAGAAGVFNLGTQQIDKPGQRYHFPILPDSYVATIAEPLFGEFHSWMLSPDELAPVLAFLNETGSFTTTVMPNFSGDSFGITPEGVNDSGERLPHFIGGEWNGNIHVQYEYAVVVPIPAALPLGISGLAIVAGLRARGMKRR